MDVLRSREDLARLGADLRVAGYTVDGVEHLLGPLAWAAMEREQILPARRAIAAVLAREGSSRAVATLTRALFLAEPVDVADLAAALPDRSLETMVRLGVVEVSGSRARALLDLRPYLDWYVVSDLGEVSTGRPLDTDYVLGVGGASHTLVDATVRRPVRRVLDLGTGCGVQALHAAAHASSVVATDVSERALRMAAMTFALNGVESVDLRQGSLFDPVAGERFDLVVTNPPFVITPRGVPMWEYRDAGMRGDRLVSTVVTEVGEYLAPGGIAQLLANWEVPRGAAWEEVVGGWLTDDLDSWVVQRDVLDPAQYAEMWIRDAGLTTGVEYERLYAAWLDDFASRDVEAIGMGLVTLRRPKGAGPRLRRLEQLTGSGPPTGASHDQGRLGGALDHGLRAHDLLAELMPGSGVGDLRLTVPGDVTEERYHRPGEEDPSVVILRQGGGFARAVQVGSLTAAAVGACDGGLPLGAIVSALAQITQTPADAVAAEVIPMARVLLVCGFLCPA